MWPNPQFPMDLIACSEETFNSNHFLCSEKGKNLLQRFPKLTWKLYL